MTTAPGTRPRTGDDLVGEGARMFARYAHAPNRLGYCGPADTGAVLAHGAGRAAGGPEEVRPLARRFSGAWPYLVILAKLTGVADPLDRRVVEAYWLGGGIGDGIDPRTFGEALLAAIGPQAGHYWKHLTPDLLDEAAPHHGFHVFGVYPWSRLLTGPFHEQPLNVLDDCRIRWGTVRTVTGTRVEVDSPRLTWNGIELGLSAPRTEQLSLDESARALAPHLAPGDLLALHWDRVTDVLTSEQVDALRRTTRTQIAATNRRLARQAARDRTGTGRGQDEAGR